MDAAPQVVLPLGLPLVRAWTPRRPVADVMVHEGRFASEHRGNGGEPHTT